MLQKLWRILLSVFRVLLFWYSRGLVLRIILFQTDFDSVINTDYVIISFRYLFCHKFLVIVLCFINTIITSRSLSFAFQVSQPTYFKQFAVEISRILDESVCKFYKIAFHSFSDQLRKILKKTKKWPI